MSEEGNGSEPPAPGSESEWEPNWDPDPDPESEPAPEPVPVAPPESAPVASSGGLLGAGLPGEGSEPDADTSPLVRPRSHRAPPPGAASGRVLGPLVAVVVVLVVVGLLIWINGRPNGTKSSAATTPGVVTTPTHHHSKPPTAPPTSPPASTAPATSPTPTTASTPPAQPSKTATTKPADRNAMATVQVLNNSRITGLAHQVAGEVAAKGWKIGVIGNLQGAIPETTVYFSPGEKAAAKHLAREFSAVHRIEPNSVAGLTQVGITLVLTSDWVG